MSYPDNPNHESWLPDPRVTLSRYNDFYAKVTNDPDTNIDEEIVALKKDLQAIFQAAKEKEDK
jgi:multiple sugar transport system substrate-binding protein